MSNIHFQEKFEARHNGPRSVETKEMLEFLGVDSLDQLIEQTVPAQIRAKQALQLPAALSEVAYLKRVKQIAEKIKCSNLISDKVILM